MRQSGASAGLVGIVEEDRMQIMSSRGYMDELESYHDTLLPLKKYHLDSIVGNGQPLREVLSAGEKLVLLKGGKSRAVVPIRREAKTIGLILMESIFSEPASDETIGFLTRFSDHASIAISNAQLYDAVESANVAKREFVSFGSHELKNPMTSIKGYTELLAAGAVGPVNEAQANFLVTIRSNVERMATLVSDLNDVSRIEAGRLRLDFKAIVLPDVMEEVVRSIKRQVEEKNQQVVIKIPSDLPNVWADRTRVLQVLTNLVSNANKYTPTGGQVLVAAEASDNRWDAVGSRRVVHLWVQDNGIGITEEDQKKIFQKFFRSEDPKTREVPGTGLGLNITKSLIEM